MPKETLLNIYNDLKERYTQNDVKASQYPIVSTRRYRMVIENTGLTVAMGIVNSYITKGTKDAK